ncbi:MAG: hypothetical protein PHQ23_08575 [Candidatus Wallbacteria bacterium]|nr:hypothetical protein [Candidatus Wallbacteria bacterium]
MARSVLSYLFFTLVLLLVPAQVCAAVGNLDFYLVYYRMGPDQNGNNLPVPRHKVFFELDRAELDFVATATSESSGKIYSSKLDNGFFKFVGIPSGFYTLRVTPDLSNGGITYSARVNNGETLSCVEETELSQAYSGHLRVSISASPNLSCRVILGYSSDLFTIQDDRIAIDTTDGSPSSLSKIVEYSPIPWGHYEGICYTTSDADAASAGTVIINVNNTVVDGWLIVRPKNQ